MRAAGKGETIRLTRAHREVLARLADGFVMDPYGKDGLGGILFRKNGEDRVVSSSTVEFLLAHGLLEHGDSVSPLRPTVAGRAIGMMANAKKRKAAGT